MVTPTSSAESAPRTALEAAHRLVAEGKHVHYVTEGESRCINRRCAPNTP
ncbi:hypothetical protein [Streptomyces sp. NPDC088794]